MNIETEVSGHYTRGGLEQAILDALAASGKSTESFAPDDLSNADEFHLGWRAATVEFATALGLVSGTKVLDIGSGIGGPARHFADGYGCEVDGVDLTPEFVDVAASLSRRCGLSGRTRFVQGSALRLPFPQAAFDVATLIHVGMNIEDKAALAAEARRVLRPGGVFGVYDIMRMTDAELPYPMPWAQTAVTSFVERPEAYRKALEGAGFRIESETSRRDLSLKIGREMREKAALHGAPALGLHIVMGPATPARLANVMRTLEAGTIAPIEMIARAV